MDCSHRTLFYADRTNKFNSYKRNNTHIWYVRKLSCETSWMNFVPFLSLSRKNVQNIDWPIFQKCPCLPIVVRFSLRRWYTHKHKMVSFIGTLFIKWFHENFCEWKIKSIHIILSCTCLDYFKYKIKKFYLSIWSH